MRTIPLHLVTIVAEAELEDRLAGELLQLGAKGYTACSARGAGARGVRASEWEGRNVRLEAIVSREVADRILERLVHGYFDAHAVIAFVQTVAVVRGEKYV